MNFTSVTFIHFRINIDEKIYGLYKCIYSYFYLDSRGSPNEHHRHFNFVARNKHVG